MIKLKYMIYLSILACYVVTQTYYECNSSGQTNCACWKIAYGQPQICESKNNEVCHLDNGCVTPCPTNDVLKTGNECLCGTSTNFCQRGQFCYSNKCWNSCTDGQTISSGCMCGGIVCYTGSLCKDNTCLSTCPNDNKASNNKCICGANSTICNEGQICKDNACLSTCPNDNKASNNKCICGANSTICNEGQICKDNACLFQIKLRKYLCLDLKGRVYLKIKLYNNEIIDLIKDDKCHWSKTFTFENSYGLLFYFN